jgi:hypothetical protein
MQKSADMKSKKDEIANWETLRMRKEEGEDG